MIIHPTRTNLLNLKEKSQSVTNSIGILKARRQALIREFLSTTLPFLRSRKDIKAIYRKAIDEMSLSIGNEGKDTIVSLTHSAGRDIGIDIIEKRIWGLQYKDVSVKGGPIREADERGYDFRYTTPHIEESIALFEKTLESLLQIAAYESKLKRLGNEIVKIARKIRVLEERVLPDLNCQIRNISQYISERERETYFRLKKFKGARQKKAYPL
jgi:V/A-type H+-transporting ATPase subunit D